MDGLLRSEPRGQKAGVKPAVGPLQTWRSAITWNPKWGRDGGKVPRGPSEKRKGPKTKQNQQKLRDPAPTSGRRVGPGEVGPGEWESSPGAQRKRPNIPQNRQKLRDPAPTSGGPPVKARPPLCSVFMNACSQILLDPSNLIVRPESRTESASQRDGVSPPPSTRIIGKIRCLCKADFVRDSGRTLRSVILHAVSGSSQPANEARQVAIKGSNLVAQGVWQGELRRPSDASRGCSWRSRAGSPTKATFTQVSLA